MSSVRLPRLAPPRTARVALRTAGEVTPPRGLILNRSISTFCLAGPAGSGKSVLMLQTLSYAQATGYVVLYLPSGTPPKQQRARLPTRCSLLTSSPLGSHSPDRLVHSARLLD